MERKRIYKLKWIRARRKMQYLLDQLLQMNKKMKQLEAQKFSEKENIFDNKVRHLNLMLRQQYALVRFYENKFKNRP